jgi:hypothetical protein
MPLGVLPDRGGGVDPDQFPFQVAGALGRPGARPVDLTRRGRGSRPEPQPW